MGNFGDYIVLAEVLHSSERKRVFLGIIRELKQSRRQRQQEGHEFAYLTIENSFARLKRLARAFFRFVTFRRGSRSFHHVK